MAQSKPQKRRQLKQTETVRQRTARESTAETKPRRLHKTASRVGTSAGAVRRFGGREYYLPMPDNHFGRFLNKRRHIIPKFFREAWRELRQVEWPDRRTTARLSLAVFIFSIVFGIIITAVDWGLGKVFRKVFVE